MRIVVKLKMDMFTEVGSIALLQDNAEEQIYENNSIVACGGAVIKEDVPFCFFKTPIL